MDVQFLAENVAFREHFQFLKNDAFFLGLVSLANQDLAADYLIIHRIPKPLLKRIRAQELVLLEENFQLL